MSVQFTNVFNQPSSTMTHKRKAALAAIIAMALMSLCATTLYNWDGVFIIMGILAGGGIAISDAEWQKHRKE